MFSNHQLKEKHWLYLTLYSFDGPFHFLHADVANLEFLGKSKADPKYCLLLVNIVMSKVYTYPIKNRKLKQER